MLFRVPIGVDDEGQASPSLPGSPTPSADDPRGSPVQVRYRVDARRPRRGPPRARAHHCLCTRSSHSIPRAVLPAYTSVQLALAFHSPSSPRGLNDDATYALNVLSDNFDAFVHAGASTRKTVVTLAVADAHRTTTTRLTHRSPTTASAATSAYPLTSSARYSTLKRVRIFAKPTKSNLRREEARVV
jgi:hypothetical protein